MMQREKDTKAERKKKAKRRILRWVLVPVVVLIVLVVFLVPAFVSSETGRKIILAKINDSIDGQVDFGSLSMSWWKGVKITDFSFNDDAGNVSVKVKQILTEPHYARLLLGSLSFGATVLDEPGVEINLAERLLEGAESAGQEVLARQEIRAVGLPIKEIDLTVNGGNFKVTDRQAESVELSQVNCRLNLRPPGRRTTFEVDMTASSRSGDGKVLAHGWVEPDRRKRWGLEGTSGDFVVEVDDLGLDFLEPIFELAGIDIEAEGRLSAHIRSETKDGQIEYLSGSVTGRNVGVTGNALKGDRFKSSVLGFAIKLKRQGKLISLSLNVDSNWLDGEASGVVPATFESLAELVEPDSACNLKGSFECKLGEALSQMPHTFGLKEGVKVTSGKLTGSVETTTKAGKKQIIGSGNLVGLEGAVGKKMIALSEPVTAEVKITSLESGMGFEKLDASASFAKVSCSGTSELLKYTADVDLARLQSELGQFIDIGQYKMAGGLFSEGEISGNKDKITAVGSSVVKDLGLSLPEGPSASEPKADIDFSVAVEPKNHILDVNFIRVKASLGEINIKDAVIPLSKEATKASELAVVANNVDLEKLQPFAVLLASFLKEMKLAGTAKSEFSVSCEKGSYRILTDATDIRNLKVSYKDEERFEQKEVFLAAHVEINPVEKGFAVRNLQLVSPQIKIHRGEIGQVSRGGKSKLEGEVDCEYDWAAVSTLAGGDWPTGLKIEGRERDTIEFSSEYPTGEPNKLVANLNTKGRLGIERAYYKGLTFSPTETEIQIVKGLLTISEFSSNVNNGELRFAGKADLKQKPIILETPGPIQIAKDVQLNDDVSRELLVYINPIFAEAFDVSGVGNFNCERLAIPLPIATKQLQIIGTISADDMRLSASDLLGQLLSVAGLGLKGQKIKVHPTRFMLWDGFLRYDDMQVDVGDNPVNFKGVIGLDRSLNMTVTLPYTFDGRTVRVGEEDVGTRISVPLRGTIDKPELDVGKLLEEQAIEKGLELLEGLLK
jgi:hypothetical protein